MSWGNTYTYAYSDTYRYSNTYCYSDGHGHRHTNAETDAHAKNCANAEASSYSSAKTIECNMLLGPRAFVLAPSGICRTAPGRLDVR